MIIEQIMFRKNKAAIMRILRAANQSEYYRAVFCDANIHIEDIQSYEDFTKIPILDKTAYEIYKFSMIANSEKRKEIKDRLQNSTDLQHRRKVCEDNGIYLKVTSGSTGNPLEILKDKNDLLREYIGLNYARVKLLGSIPKGKYVWIWPASEKIREYFYEDGKVNIYKDTQYGFKYMIPEYSQDSFGRLFSFIKENSISWITAPPSMMCLFAQYIETNNLEIRFSYIECHSEKLYEWQSNYLKRIFGCQPSNVYSSNEIQFMGITDYNHIMHVISQNVFLELIEDKEGERKVYATSLCAQEIPIIRYCLGDVARWKEKNVDEMSRSPSFIISGYRCNDYIITRDGGKFEPFIISDLLILLNDSFSLGVKEYVVQQNGYEKFTFYFSEDVKKSVHRDEKIRDYIHNYLYSILKADVDIDYMNIDKIREETGTNKYKYFLGMKNE